MATTALLALLVKGSLVLAVAAALDWGTRRKAWFSAAERHALWSAAFAFVLLLPLAELVVPDRVLAELPPAIAQVGSPAADAPERELGALTLATRTVSEPTAFGASSWTKLWLLVAAGLALRSAVAVVLLGRRARAGRSASAEWRRDAGRVRQGLGLERSVHLRFADVATPMSFGCLRPTILLPRDAVSWSSAQREVVLLHELAHVRRGDYAANLIASAACALAWFHPLVWWGRARQRLHRELACDDCVLARGAGPLDYAEQLLDFARRMSRRAALPAEASGMGGRRELETRVHALLDGSRRRSNLGASARRAGLIAAAASALGLASFELVADASSLEHRRLPDWMAATRDADPLVREEAAWLLGRAADRRGFYELLELWDDPAPRVRETAAWAMARINCSPAFLTLSCCLEHPDPRMRARAAEFLRSFPAGWEVQRPSELLPMRYGYSWTHLRAEFAQLGEHTAVERVRALLSDPDPSVRREASSTLRAWGVPTPE